MSLQGKTAFIHDRILNIGGAESVFFDIIKNSNYKEAKIFTLLSDKNFIEINGAKIQTQKIVPNRILKILIRGNRSRSRIIRTLLDYRNLMPLYPILVRLLSFKIRKYQPDKAVISSFAIAKNISFIGYKKLYLHSPMQYIWDVYEEYIAKFKFPIKQIFILVSKYLRIWDKKFTKFDEVEFNSFYTAELAKNIYNIEGKVVYPKIREEFLKENENKEEYNYYVYVGRLVKFARELDKIIELFNQTGDNLIIAGSGPDENYLKSIAGDKIIFVGHIIDTQELITLIKRAKGNINLTKESFGINTAESLALGVPIFGYKYGATKELVDKNSGILVENKNINTLINKFEEFKNTKFDNKKIKENLIKKYKQHL